MRKKLDNRASALSALMWLLLLALIPAQLSARDFEYTHQGQTLTYRVLDESAKTVTPYEGYEKGKDKHNISGAVVIPAEVSDGTNTYTVTAIGEEAFYICLDLTSIEIPNTVTTIGKYAFGSCESLSRVVIPNSVTAIGEKAFYKCMSLSSIVIPNSVTTIGDRAFEYCYGLKSITLSESLTKVGGYVFEGDERLRSITFPASVKELGFSVFYGCKNLRYIKFLGSEIPATEYSTFADIPAFTQIVVPADKVDAWKALFERRKDDWTQCAISDKYTPVKKTIAGVKPKPVDMGLSVKWADVDLGSATKTTSGKLLKLSDQDMEAYLGEGWRVPTKYDFEELFNNCVAQVYLTPAGVPSKIVYTSKKNGAKITFFFPKTAFIKSGQKLANPLKGTYQALYACEGDDVMLRVAAKLPENIRKPIQNYVAAAKVKSMNIADWPDEMLKWLKSNAQGVNLDSKFLYGSKDDFIDDVNVNIFECYFRPVYEVDESSDED